MIIIASHYLFTKMGRFFLKHTFNLSFCLNFSARYWLIGCGHFPTICTSVPLQVKEMWCSILSHVANVHEGHGDKFPMCKYGAWIKKGNIRNLYSSAVKQKLWKTPNFLLSLHRHKQSSNTCMLLAQRHRPVAHGPQWLTWVNSYKSLIQHFSLSVAMATNQNE